MTPPDNKDMPDLLPCPFCGATNLHMFMRNADGVMLYTCDQRRCPVRGKVLLTLEEWNTRAVLAKGKGE